MWWSERDITCASVDRHHVRKRGLKRRRRPEEHEESRHSLGHQRRQDPDTHQIARHPLDKNTTPAFGVEPHLHHHISTGDF